MITIQKISTHKAIKTKKEIQIIQIGLIIDGEVFSKDQVLYSLPLDHQDDVFAIMERYEENNRCNMRDLNRSIF